MNTRAYAAVVVVLDPVHMPWVGRVVVVVAAAVVAGSVLLCLPFA